MSELGVSREVVHFCRGHDGVRIAYAVHGSGPPLILAKNWISHLQYDWDDPVLGHLLDALGRIATVVRYDERGYGLSDWEPDDFSLEARVGDLEAVAAVASFDRYAVMAMGQAGQVAISHIVQHPERVSRLILSGTFAGVTECSLLDRVATLRVTTVLLSTPGIRHSRAHHFEGLGALALGRMGVWSCSRSSRLQGHFRPVEVCHPTFQARHSASCESLPAPGLYLRAAWCDRDHALPATRRVPAA